MDDIYCDHLTYVAIAQNSRNGRYRGVSREAVKREADHALKLGIIEKGTDDG